MASRIKGITVEIGGDTSGLEKSLSDVNNSIKKTQSQLRDVNSLLKLDPSNTVLLAQKQELLQQAIGDTEKKQQALEQAQEDVTKAFERGDLGKDQYMAFQREVEETRGPQKAQLSWKPLISFLPLGIRSRISGTRRCLLMRRQKMQSQR